VTQPTGMVYLADFTLPRKPLIAMRAGKGMVPGNPTFDYSFLGHVTSVFFRSKLFLTSRRPFLITFTRKSYLHNKTYIAYKFHTL